MFVIGTAGHVDHGKSTLIKALTGIDPDRLAEEKAREMTIDLGFAWFQLEPHGEEIGVVDVPGHRDFIENMLAGVGGIDLALFVIAADEGVMPQTLEHLAILDLLEVQGGIVALTKIDLIDDPDWLELVTLEVAEALTGTVLADAPIVPVSARDGRGLDTLKSLIGQQLAEIPPRPDNGRPRLAVDRVFSLPGFGTIVTGTLAGGRFQVGDAIEIQPSGLSGRIRGLQTHKTKREAVLPGSRVAINLTGVDRNDVKRGDVVAKPGVVGQTILFDAHYRHLPDAPTPLKHNMDVKLFLGAAEVVARTRVLGAAKFEPGQEGWLQLALAEPVALLKGDRFILRRPSPGATLGGGSVVDPQPGRRHRRFQAGVLERLETLSHGSPAEQLLQALTRLEPTTESVLLQKSGLDKTIAAAALAELETTAQLIRLNDQLVTHSSWQKWEDSVTAVLAVYHNAFPLRAGMPRQECRSRVQLKAAVFTPLIALAADRGVIVDAGPNLHLPDFSIHYSPAQKTAVENLMQRFDKAGVNSPSVKDAKAAVGNAVYFSLVESGDLLPINNDVVYRQAEVEQITGKITNYLKAHGRISAAQVRDLLQTSRKYAIALLEYLDAARVTRRIGDERELF